MGGRFPVRENLGNFEQTGKVRENLGNFEQTGKVRENHTKYFKSQGISDNFSVQQIIKVARELTMF